MPVWMYCGISCKQCGSDTLTEVELDRIAMHDGPAAPERVWGVAGNQLNSGARHASIYGEMTEARRTCDVERLWRPAGGNGDFDNSPDPGPDSAPDPEPNSGPDPDH